MTQDNKPWKGMIRAVNYTCVNADGNPETNHYLDQFDGEHWNQIPAYHDRGFGKLTRLEDRGPRGKDGGVLLAETSYILTITDGSISYVGPFVSPAAASDYGDRCIDDPRWNVIPERLVLPLEITAPVEPERVTRWANVYRSWLDSYDSPEESDDYEMRGRLALWRITYDKDTGLNPVIEVEGETE